MTDTEPTQNEFKLVRRSPWEAHVRTKIAFICMASRVGENGELKQLTDELIAWLKENQP